MVEEKETEAWIGKSRMVLSDDILFVQGVGDIDDEMALEIKDTANKFLDMVDGKLNILMDMDKAGKPSPKARKSYMELSEDERIGKVALYGIHPVAKVLASFVIGVTKKKDVRFFSSKEEALAWLKA